jgi:hypothetical protein
MVKKSVVNAGCQRIRPAAKNAEKADFACKNGILKVR